MGSIFYVFFFVVAVVNAFPDYLVSNGHDVTVDLKTREFIVYPVNEQQAVEALSVADSIKDLIDQAISDIPDPVRIDDQHVNYALGEVASVVASTRGVYVKGQSQVYTETLSVSLLNPLRPRVTYKFVLSELIINIDSLNIVINAFGIRWNCVIRGQVIIKNSTLSGIATVNVLTQAVTGLTTNLHVGTIQSTLVGHVNGVNVTSLITTVVTNIIPQILTLYSETINQAIADIILGFL